MPQPLVWVKVKSTGEVPTPRSGHTITTVGKYNILFGGLEAPKNESKILPNNQVYTLRIVGNNCEWRLVPCGGDAPLPRTKHAACAISQDKLFIFGGHYTSTLRFNDAYILRTSNNKISFFI